MPTLDPRSFFDATQPLTRHLRLALAVDFERRHVSGEACSSSPRRAGPLDLDTKGLRSTPWSPRAAASVPCELGDEEPVLGRRLRLKLPAGTRSVAVRYATSPEALGAAVADARADRGRAAPVPLQPVPAHPRAQPGAAARTRPRARVTYEAALTVPEPLAAVMSAGPAGERPGPRPGTRVFRFRMPQPIPPYLLALAVGELESRDLSPALAGLGRAGDGRDRRLGVRRRSRR